MVLMKIFNAISSYIYAVASHKLVTRTVLPDKSLPNNRDIFFYDEMELIFLWTPLQSLM